MSLQAGYSERVALSLVRTTVLTRTQSFSGAPVGTTCTKDELVAAHTYEIDGAGASFADHSNPHSDTGGGLVTNGFRFYASVNPDLYTTALVGYIPLAPGDYFVSAPAGIPTNNAGKTVTVKANHIVEDWVATIVGTGIDGYYFGHWTVTLTTEEYAGSTGLVAAPVLPIIQSGHTGSLTFAWADVPAGWPNPNALDWRISAPSLSGGGLNTGVGIASGGPPSNGGVFCSPWYVVASGDALSVTVPPDIGAGGTGANVVGDWFAWGAQARVDPEYGWYGTSGDPFTGFYRIVGDTCSDTRTGVLPWPPVPDIKTGIFAPFTVTRDLRCDDHVTPPPPDALNNPFNLQDKSGKYHATGANASGISYKRSDFGTPSAVGWGAAVTIAAPAGKLLADPRVIVDERQTVKLAYAQQTIMGGAWDGVYLRVSHDDGATWGTATLAIASGKHPTVAFGQDGAFDMTVLAAYVGPNGGPGVITARTRSIGDTAFGTAFNFKDDMGADLVAADDTFHIQQARDDQSRWMLHILIFGEGATSQWTSFDETNTWVRIT